MHVIMVMDDQIRNFKERPHRLEEICNPLFDPGCNLVDSWRSLHQVLTAGTNGEDLPLCALKKGEVEYTKGLSDPAHAIYSVTARGFAEELCKFSESSFFPYDSFFRKLRDFATTASKEGKGLVFCYYEGW